MFSERKPNSKVLQMHCHFFTEKVICTYCVMISEDLLKCNKNQEIKQVQIR